MSKATKAKASVLIELLKKGYTVKECEGDLLFLCNEETGIDGDCIFDVVEDRLVVPARKHQRIREFGEDLHMICFKGINRLWDPKKKTFIRGVKFASVSFKTHFFRMYLNDKEGLLSHQGKVLVPLEYKHVSTIVLRDRYVRVVGEGGKNGVFDIKSKTLVLPLVYDDVTALNDQFHVSKKGKSGVWSSEEARFVVPISYADIDQTTVPTVFLAYVKRENGLMCGIVRAGQKKPVLRCGFDYIRPLTGNLYTVGAEGFLGIYDIEKKKFELDIEYRDIRSQGDGIYLVGGRESGFGLWSADFRKLVLPVNYDSIRLTSEEGLYLVTKDGRTGIWNKKTCEVSTLV